MKNIWARIFILSTFFLGITMNVYCDGAAQDYKLVEFVEDGLKVVVGMKNDKKHGPITKYYANGNKMFEAGFFEGVPDGKTITYYENGNVWRESQYLMGERTGIEYVYDETGRIERKEVYEKGQLVSKDVIETKREYYDNKILKIERDFFGEEVVHQRFYDTQGRMIEEHLNQNRRNKKIQYYYDTGKVRRAIDPQDYNHLIVGYSEEGNVESRFWLDKTERAFYWEVFNERGTLLYRQKLKEPTGLHFETFDNEGTLIDEISTSLFSNE